MNNGVLSSNFPNANGLKIVNIILTWYLSYCVLLYCVRIKCFPFYLDKKDKYWRIFDHPVINKTVLIHLILNHKVEPVIAWQELVLKKPGMRIQKIHSIGRGMKRPRDFTVLLGLDD